MADADLMGKKRINTAELLGARGAHGIPGTAILTTSMLKQRLHRGELAKARRALEVARLGLRHGTTE